MIVASVEGCVGRSDGADDVEPGRPGWISVWLLLEGQLESTFRRFLCRDEWFS